jgi:ABC-type transporter Mla MlaB component
MLKIVLTQDEGGPMLRLAGQVIGPWVEELERVGDAVMAVHSGVALDLADVSFVSREGVALLQGLRDRGVVLRHCSAFLVEQLRTRECCR